MLIPLAVSAHSRPKKTPNAKSEHAAVTFMLYSQTLVSNVQTRLPLHCNPEIN